MKRVMIMVTVLLACCGEYSVPERPRSFAVDSGVTDAGTAAMDGSSRPDDRNAEVLQSSPVKGNLCMVLRDGEDQVLLPGITIIAKKPDEACVADGDAMEITVEKQLPVDVDLYGEMGIRYCIGIRRLSGYITISHERGDIDRADDEFYWCVVQQSSHPEHMTFRSLTREARVRLLLPHGM